METNKDCFARFAAALKQFADDLDSITATLRDILDVPKPPQVESVPEPE